MKSFGINLNDYQVDTSAEMPKRRNHLFLERENVDKNSIHLSGVSNSWS